MVAGRYFDGVSSRGLPVDFGHDNGVLKIVGTDFCRDVAASELRFTNSHAPAPICVAIRDGGICEMADSAESRALLALLGAGVPIESWLRAHRMALVCLAVAFLSLMAGLWRWGIPLAADVIVDRIPDAWDQRIGESVLQQLESSAVFKPSTLAAERQAQLERRFDALAKPAGAPDYRIVFRQLGTPNAFALPGGSIVVADELVALAPHDDAALMTVLGHELGHLHYRHGMRGIVRAALFSAAAAWYLGDISGVAASAAAGFTSLSYSREAERAADQYALQLMRANGVSTHPAVLLFQRLIDWQPARPTEATVATASHVEVPEYLSTHPNMRDRIFLFEQGNGEVPAPGAATMKR